MVLLTKCYVETKLSLLNLNYPTHSNTLINTKPNRNFVTNHLSLQNAKHPRKLCLLLLDQPDKINTVNGTMKK